LGGEAKAKGGTMLAMDEGRKRVIGMMAATAGQKPLS